MMDQAGTPLDRFRVIVKDSPHPTRSLTLACFDIAGESSQEIKALCKLQGKVVIVRRVDGDCPPAVLAFLEDRRQRRLDRLAIA